MSWPSMWFFKVESMHRMYLHAYVPGLQYAADLVAYLHKQLGLYHLQKGRQVVLSLKVPDDSADTMAQCDALAADIASLGYAGMVWTVLWHEP